MQLVYSFLITLYGFATRIAAIFNSKAAAWVNGRRDYFRLLEISLNQQMPDRASAKTAWFHCASLGEFEQGRPLIEAFRKQYPKWYIVLTFFSPSGYEVRKNYNGADLVAYLPLDTRRNALRFIEMVNPALVIYVKYEFWFNYLSLLQQKKIPTVLVSAIFRPGQHFFKWYGEWPRKILAGFTHIFVQNEASLELLQFIDIQNAVVNGDTRFDRVADIANQAGEISLARAFAAGHKVLVAGSTWTADETLIFELADHFQSLKLIIAPHEVTPEHLAELKKRNRPDMVFFSEADESAIANASILVIDSIGMLSRLYRYGDIAYIGGGFGVGIHNILEAAVYGNPVVFGPNYHKFDEAVMLETAHGAFSIRNREELIAVVGRMLDDVANLEAASAVCRDFVARNTGATDRIMKAVAGLV